VTAVAHYLERWLEISAGFVAAHLAASRHRGVVVARDGWLNLEAFPHEPRYSLDGTRSRTPDVIKKTVLRIHLEKILRDERAELVHVHFGYAANDVLRATEDRPYVLSLHGHDVTGLVRDEPDRYLPVTHRVDATIVPSQFLADAAVTAGFDPIRIHVIPSGVDTSFFTPTPIPNGPPTVAFVGRFVEKKGIRTLLAAWPAIAAASPNARLELIGDGPLVGLVPTDDPMITHLPPDATRRREQVRDLIARSTVVVTPSQTGPDGDSESLLLVNLEAAASGRPVVSTWHGGIPEYVVDGDTGLLVEPGDAASFADAVVRVLADRSLAVLLGGNGADHARQWDTAACTARVDDLYEELLRGR
jgi:glycosyltransferase involved in cell wall biosynthesis